jgi:hypothetical protein
MIRKRLYWFAHYRFVFCALVLSLANLLFSTMPLHQTSSMHSKHKKKDAWTCSSDLLYCTACGKACKGGLRGMSQHRGKSRSCLTILLHSPPQLVVLQSPSKAGGGSMLVTEVLGDDTGVHRVGGKEIFNRKG